MDKINFTQTMTILGVAYNKEFTKEELGVWYQFFKEIDAEILKNAITNLIKTNKFMPSISEIISECESSKNQTQYGILEFMKSKGYFKSEAEYTKAINFLDNGVIPYWLKNDIESYKKENKKITTSELKFIE